MSLREKAGNKDLMQLGNDDDYKVQDGETIKKIPKALLYSTEQIRTDFDHNALKELAENIKQNGQQMPIIVHPVDNTNKYLIHQGERRWRAIQQIKELNTVDCIIRSTNTLFQQLSENIQRESLNPYEIANAIKNLKQTESIKSNEVAKRLGKSKVWASRYESIHKIPEELLDLLKEKNVMDINTITELQRASNIDLEKTLEFVGRNELITRDMAIKFKEKLEKNPEKNSKKNTNKKQQKNKEQQEKTNKQDDNESDLAVRLDGAIGFLMSHSSTAEAGTVDIKMDGAIINVPITDIEFLGYRQSYS